VTPS
jgi:uncharacterized protein with HEPN domain